MDVNPIPKSVEKVAKSFGCGTFYPEISLTNVEKMKLLRVKKIKKIEPEKIGKIIESIRTESKKGIEESRALIFSAISPLDSQLKSLSEMIILLETRIVALEKLFRERATVPVVIE